MNPRPANRLRGLDPERWRLIEPLLDEALELEPEEVPAYLDRRCAGLPELRGQVEALLEADSKAGAFLSIPAVDLMTWEGQDAGHAEHPEFLPEIEIPDPPPRVLGRYRVEGELGSGGMGIVHRGRDEALGRSVAIKALPRELERDPASLARFLVEAKVLGSLHHPNIASLRGIETSETGQRFLILEFVLGRTLCDRLNDGPLPMEVAFDVCGQIAEALSAAHSRGVIHRDLKPGNVMITDSGLVKVVDFGLARSIPGPREARALPAEREASHDRFVGTPGYMSPEQVLGLEQDARVDLFSFGCVLYECLTGRRAFRGLSTQGIIAAQLSSTVDFSFLPAAVPDRVRHLLARSLEKSPERRLGDARAFAEALHAAGAPGAPVPSAVRAASDEVALIGRDREIEACSRLLDRARLLTLTGAGGCGKTRLARELMGAWAERFPAGVWFVDLTPVSDPAALSASVAEAVGADASSMEQVLETLARATDARRGLLVLDNCERLLAASARLAADVLDRCPGARILATSREWLGAPGEQVVRLEPLATPDQDLERHPAELMSVASVRLFVEFARRVRRDFRLDDQTAPWVARICRRLDGLPLAIRLVAAKLPELELDSIALALDSRLASAAPPPSADVAADGALRATLQWSYDQLVEEERVLFRGLAVFAGGWSLASATAVCGADQDEFGMLGLITRLVDRSLVVPAGGDRIESRYRFLEPVRDFAASLLAADAGAHAAERHLQHFVALAERMAPDLVEGPGRPRAMAELEAEHQNVLAAARTAEGRTGGADLALRLAGAVWWFWYVRGHLALGRSVLSRALALPGAEAPTPARALALHAAGCLAVYHDDYVEGRRLSQEAVDLQRRLGDRHGVAKALLILGINATMEGGFAEARERYHEAIGLFRELGDDRRLARTLNNLGVVARHLGDHRSARASYVESLEPTRKAGDTDGLAVTLVNLGHAALRLGEREEARLRMIEALTLIGDAGMKRAAIAALEVAGEALLDLDNPAEAARVLGSAEVMREAMGVPGDPWWRAYLDEVSTRLRDRLDAGTLRRCWGEGRKRSFEIAVARASKALVEARLGARQIREAVGE